MKTFHLSILFMTVVFIVLSCSSTDREISPQQLQQRADGLHYAVNEDDPFSGKVVELYESGQKQTEKTFRKGFQSGLTTEWYPDGQKRSETGFENGKQSGKYQFWHENGQKRSEGNLKQDKQDGQWVFWYENGQVKQEGNYIDGLRNGLFTFWYENGQLRRETEYASDRIVDILNHWNENGNETGVGEVSDVDGNTYLTIEIGDQWWMMENLKVTHYRNMDSISHVPEESGWKRTKKGAYCDYDNDTLNVTTYGRLYNEYAAVDQRNIAPEGWHVPSESEWKDLIDYLESNVGGKVKEVGTRHWLAPNQDATNESGFTALPGGMRGSRGTFTNMGEAGLFWAVANVVPSTSRKHPNLCVHYVQAHYGDIRKEKTGFAGGGHSIRCVKD